MSCARRAAPSQRMQCVRRAGERRTWAYRKPSPASPSTFSDGTRKSSKRTTAWPPGKQVSSESISRSITMPGLFMSARNMVARAVRELRHDDRDRRAFRARDEPLAAVDHVVVAVARGGGLQHARVGACAGRRLGHAEARADRAGGERPQPALLLRRRGDRFEQMHVALVGRGDVQRDRTERRIARFLEDDRLSRRARARGRRTRATHGSTAARRAALCRSAPRAVPRPARAACSADRVRAERLLRR